MQIVLNGEPLEIGDNATIASLLQQLDIDKARVAVELNTDIVSKSTYETQLLSAGDRIEIVHFVGGGQPL